MTTEIIDQELAYSKIQLLLQNIEKVVKGKTEKIQLAITALIAKGHILIEDNPGTGKTILARTFAESIAQSPEEQSFKRVQFTPDLLPMDLLGSHIYDDNIKDFVFKKGPLFCNILLADEINRASPKVQSALLECMAEGQISAGDQTYKLAEVFFAIATQNPIEMEGTYPLPAAQLDRFTMKLHFGYANEEDELSIYHNYNKIDKQLKNIEAVVTLEEIVTLQQQANEITVHDEIVRAVNNIVRNTRAHSDISLGASTRAGIAFLRSLRAFAMVNNRNYVTEDDLLYLYEPVLMHRLIFKNKVDSRKILHNIVELEIKRLAKLKN